jgi:hypothetical protein
MSYFVFIVTSRDRPEYEIFDSMRREQLEDLQIPHKFLLNCVDASSCGYTLKEDEVYYPDPSFTPGMFWKFYAEIQRGLPQVDFILRLNSSTFVDFQRFEEVALPLLPRKKCFAGNVFDFDVVGGCTPMQQISIISGTAMIFSRDVLEWFSGVVLDMDNENVKYCIEEEPDDCAISNILRQLGGYRFFDLGAFFTHMEAVAEVLNESTIFYRIKNDDRINTDVLIWQSLLKRLA